MDRYKVKIWNQEFIIELEKITDDSGEIIPLPSQGGFAAGINSFPWFPQNKLHAIGLKHQRVYCSSGWIWQPGGIAVQPMHQAETIENHSIDDMLVKAAGFGIETLLCVHQTPEWFRNTGRHDGANDYPPCKSGSYGEDPQSYKDYADFLWQITARYGRVKRSDTDLKVDVTPRWSGDILNEKKSGLGILAAIEPWNEPDKWWKKGGPESEAYFLPEEAAALLLACYTAIKSADPSMLVVMPGISDFDMNYIGKMDAWFKAKNGGIWPCDVFNVHHYSNVGNKRLEHPAKWAEQGACVPAEDGNFQTIADILVFAKGINKKVWVTEFGADKKTPSPMAAKSPEHQAKIIVDSLKAYQAIGVERAYIFNACDEDGGDNGGLFLTSGVFTSQKDGYKDTPASVSLKAHLQSS